jgi:hypothetical protein
LWISMDKDKNNFDIVERMYQISTTKGHNRYEVGHLTSLISK